MTSQNVEPHSRHPFGWRTNAWVFALRWFFNQDRLFNWFNYKNNNEKMFIQRKPRPGLELWPWSSPQLAHGSWANFKKKQIWPIVECRTWTNAKDSTMAAPLQSQIGTTTHFICLTRNCLAEEQWFQLMYSRSIPLFKRTPRAYPASCVKPSFLAHAQLGLRTSFEPFHATKQCESCVQRLGQNFEALPWVLVWILTWHVFIRGAFLQK